MLVLKTGCLFFVSAELFLEIAGEDEDRSCGLDNEVSEEHSAGEVSSTMQRRSDSKSRGCRASQKCKEKGPKTPQHASVTMWNLGSL